MLDGYISKRAGWYLSEELHDDQAWNHFYTCPSVLASFSKRDGVLWAVLFQLVYISSSCLARSRRHLSHSNVGTELA